jgi:hypothetical protein
VPKRDAANDINLLREQYLRLASALDGYYSGHEFEALNAAVCLRVLVHDTPKSRSMLSRFGKKHRDLDIRHKRVNPEAVAISIKVAMRISGDGESKIVRSDFSVPDYDLVPLDKWWSSPYQVVGTTWQSKQKIVLDVANKAGGAHVDDKVPLRHAQLVEPPFMFGLAGQTLTRPNLAYAITAQAGCEMQDYLERHFAMKR